MKITVKTYTIKLRSDAGTVKLRVTATSKVAARAMVMAAEACPLRAIESVNISG